MAYIMFDDNQVVITGKIVMDFTFSHKICGECFYKTELQVKRLSDSVDTIPVLISEQIADITKSRVGEFAEIYGEFHSHNLREENHTRLELYVFAREVKFVEVNDSKTDYTNRILLEGTICKPTVYRKTPLKKEITDLLLAVNRSFGKSDYILVKERIEGGANEKAVLRLFINCPFVCINFDFFWLNKARQLYMDF